MEKAPLNASNSTGRTANAVVNAPGAGAGRGLLVASSTKNSSSTGLPGNARMAPSAKVGGSFGGVTKSKSLLPVREEIIFGSFGPSGLADRSGTSDAPALPKNKDPLEVSDGPPVAVVNNDIERVGKVEHQTGQSSHKRGAGEVHAAAVKDVVEESNPPRAPKASPNAAWGPGGTAKSAERNRNSDPISSILKDEDFPALGAPLVGKSSKPNSRALKPEPSNSSVDLSARAELPPKWDSRREAGTAGADGWGRGREEPNAFKRDREVDRWGRGREEPNAFKRDREVDSSYDERRDPISTLGRTLTRILRHQAEELKIKVRNDGYVIVKDLLKLPMKTGSGRPLSSHTMEDVMQAVKEDNKQRFGIKEENGVLLIRANQGHSMKTIETEHLLKPVLTAEEIPVCVHGTYRRFLSSIAKEGLKRMNRNHVHFASGLSPTDGVISGMRKTSEVLIYLDVSKALEDGMKLFISENGVILTDGFNGVVPPKYFKNVCSWPDNEPMNMR